MKSKRKVTCYGCGKPRNVGGWAVLTTRGGKDETLPPKTAWHANCLLKYFAKEQASYSDRVMKMKEAKEWLKTKVDCFFRKIDEMYYSEVWGIDINRDKKIATPINNQGNWDVISKFVYEDWFPCKQDFLFPDLEIGARVFFTDDKQYDAINRIGFRVNDKACHANCIHTIIQNANALRGEDVNWDASRIIGKAKLYPIEHFVALRSFVQGLSEMSLETIFTDSVKNAPASFGFNSAMQSQFLQCLNYLFPKGTLELCWRIVSYHLKNNPEWFFSHLQALWEVYPLERLFADSEFTGNLPESIQARIKQSSRQSRIIFAAADGLFP